MAGRFRVQPRFLGPNPPFVEARIGERPPLSAKIPRMKNIELRGVIAAVFTPFTDSGEVDFESLSSLVRFLLDKGIHGFFPCGSTGEGPLMRLEQRKRVLERVIETVSGQVPVLAHVGTTNTEEAIELATHAEGQGVVAVAAITPFFIQPPLEGLAAHYQAIGDAVGVPTFAYNLPIFGGYNITPDDAQYLFERAGVKGIKDSTGNLIQLQKVLDTAPEGTQIINGADTVMFSAMTMGTQAQISGMANVVPELMVSLYESFAAGDLDNARAQQRRINDVVRTFTGPPVATRKAALKMRGIAPGLPRAPLIALPEAEAQQLKTRLEALDLYW